MSANGDDFGRDEADRPLAAEYVLGVLDAGERARAEAFIANDAAFAAEVAFWEARLGPLVEDVREVVPPPGLWSRIEAALPRAVSMRQADAKPGLWESLAFWRGLSFGSVGLAAASLAALFLVPREPPPAMPMVARLGPPSGGASFVAAVDPMRNSVMIIPASLAGADTRVPELWLVPADGVPRSLGVFDPDRPAAMPVPEALMPHMTREAALAVSMEPAGGSPTGKPTGPVVAQGPLVSF